jgi:DNA mismatch repair ATPase MutS
VKAFLMYRDQDFDLRRELPANEAALTQDLELDTLLNAMALGDQFLFDVAKKALLLGLQDLEAIVYRQQVLLDCLAQPAIIRQLYDVAVEAIQSEKKIWSMFMSSPGSILYSSAQVLELLVVSLKRVRTIADEHAGSFQSDGFLQLFATLAKELDDEYILTVERHLSELRFRRGVLISAELGKGNKGIDYVVRKPHALSWRERISLGNRTSYSFTIPARDENGARALSELRGRGIDSVANALAQSSDHILSFFTMLRTELAFYIGCLNLHAQLVGKDEPTGFPVPLTPHRLAFAAQGLYDPCLSLHLSSRAVGNDVTARGKSLVMTTGANQGGKSTFLRSVGLAYLMMQSGMFVAAGSFRASVSNGVFTHFKREEDATMKSGKLDEELGRMSDIAERIASRSILLCNESFAATNEREGSEIARQVVRAMTEAGIRVFFVTHLFDLAHGFYRQGLETALFLRAERQADGRRTFRLIQGEPLPTSYGEDSYRRIFANTAAAAAAVSS